MRIEASWIRTTPLKAIRRYCLDCSNGSPGEVRRCHLHQCPLYVYRMGRSPKVSELSPKFVTSTPLFTPELKDRILDEDRLSGGKSR